MAKKNSAKVVSSVSGKSIVMPGKMGAAELAEFQMMKTRSRRFADGRKKASRNACRGNSAGRGTL